MRLIPLPLNGLYLLEPRVFQDARGWFFESFRSDVLRGAGLVGDFPQDNHSRSVKGTVRGLHYQSAPGQVKLVRCTIGAIWDVAVDIRRDSPTFGKWYGVELTSENRCQLYIPLGFAHGFSVLSDHAEVQYKCSAFYNAATECGLRWNDPTIGVDWKVDSPILSERDQSTPTWAEWNAPNH
ncbi:dTDP-4-dehydrorhamnose 3,5-epimerase [bacterium]|nr:dTDP-4-dehydrorhamnose 3,5-epimerase [bacterium]